LLDLEPGQSKTAHVAIPHGTTLKICPDKECRCGAPTCIAITGPTTATVIGTTAEVIIQPSKYVLPAGTYIIKARAESPDLEKITMCRVAYQAVVDAQKLITKSCNAAVDEIINQLSNIASASPEISSWLDSSLLQNLREQGYALCEKGEDVPKFIYGYFCIKKKIYLEVTPT
jgi:hypothetical protein